MITNVYGIWDEKAESYGVPYHEINHGTAIRKFADLAKDERSYVNKHPGDYKLYMLGTFDDATGQMISQQPPQYLSSGSEHVKLQNSEIQIKN